MKQFVRKMRALPLQSIKNCRQLFKQKMQIDISILSNLQNQINKYMKEFLSFVLAFFLSQLAPAFLGSSLFSSNTKTGRSEEKVGRRKN